MHGLKSDINLTKEEFNKIKLLVNEQGKLIKKIEKRKIQFFCSKLCDRWRFD